MHLVNAQNSWLNLDAMIDASGGLYHTTNIHTGWELVEIHMLSESIEKISKIAFLDELKGGKPNTNNGGETWTLQYVDFNNISATYKYKNMMCVIVNRVGNTHFVVPKIVSEILKAAYE